METFPPLHMDTNAHYVKGFLPFGYGAHLYPFVHTSPMMIIIHLNNIGDKNA